MVECHHSRNEETKSRYELRLSARELSVEAFQGLLQLEQLN